MVYTYQQPERDVIEERVGELLQMLSTTYKL